MFRFVISDELYASKKFRTQNGSQNFECNIQRVQLLDDQVMGGQTVIKIFRNFKFSKNLNLRKEFRKSIDMVMY